jgi:hypothetical protein
LNFEAAVFCCGNNVAFDQWVVEPGGFPIFTPVAFQVDLAFDQAETCDASFDVVIVRFFVIGSRRDGG